MAYTPLESPPCASEQSFLVEANIAASPSYIVPCTVCTPDTSKRTSPGQSPEQYTLRYVYAPSVHETLGPPPCASVQPSPLEEANHVASPSCVVPYTVCTPGKGECTTRGQSPEQYTVQYVHTPYTHATYNESEITREVDHSHACQWNYDAPMQPIRETHDQRDPCYTDRGESINGLSSP